MPGKEEDSGEEESLAATSAANEATDNPKKAEDSLKDGKESELHQDRTLSANDNDLNGDVDAGKTPPGAGDSEKRSPRSSNQKKKSSQDCDETLSEIMDNSPTTKNQDDETSSSGDHSALRTGDDAKRIPIREILTPPRRPPVRRKKDLDPNTLELFKAALGESKGDTLEEDELMHFATRLHRNADHQASYLKSMSKRHGPEIESGNESDDSFMFAECLAEEEEYAIGNEQFKKIVSTLNKKTAATAPKSQSSGFKLDRRTLNWIKGGSGIHRTEKHMSKSRVNTRRRARRQSRTSRAKKEAKGLDVLCEAIEEVEIDHGPFPKAIRRAGPPKRRIDADDVRQRKSAKKIRSELKSKAEAIALKRRYTEGAGARPTKRRQLPRQMPKRGRFNQSPLLDIEICTDLKELDQKWMEASADAREEAPPCETEFSFRRRTEKTLHPKLSSAGVRHRLPSMETFKRSPIDIPEKVAPGVYGPPRTRHSDHHYASMCSRLMNMLLKMRIFVTAEFFYSDLDREWYNHDTVGAQLSKLGMKPDQAITVRQWKAIRRLIRQKPRRFSPSFIAAQLNERNMYRCTVRRLQSNPLLATPAGFPFHVYAPIPVGTIVTAYCKFFRMIQRGKVLAYEKSSAVYFIEFESKHFGYELCPDSDVATSGIPQILVKAPPTRYLIRRERAGVGCGTSTGPLLGLHGNIDFNLDSVLKEQSGVVALEKARQYSVLSQNRIGEEVLNKDAFLELIDVLDEARERKREALAILLDCSEDDLGLAHYSWLRGYFGSTQAVLQKALGVMRVLYGGLYRNSGVSDERGHARKTIGKYLTVHSETDIPESVTAEWAEVVAQRTLELASTAASIENPANSETNHTGGVSAPLTKSLTACGQAIVLARFASLTTEDKMGSTESLAILKKVTDELCRESYPEANDVCHICSGFLEARERSAVDLKEALTLLECELRLSRFQSLQPALNVGEAVDL